MEVCSARGYAPYLEDFPGQLAPRIHCFWRPSRALQSRKQIVRHIIDSEALIARQFYDKFVLKLNWVDEQLVRLQTQRR
jgi:hypothetical protein